ncbi:MFS transporter [Citricoccus nitrophenolicus]
MAETHGSPAGTPAGPDQLGIVGVLRLHPYRLFLLVQFMTAIIVWVLATTVQWTFVASGQSGVVIALVPALFGLPFVLFALPVGVAVVRWARPGVMAVALASIATVSAALAVWALGGAESVVQAAVLVFLSGSGLVVALLAWQSMLPGLVGRPGIVSATVLDAAAFNGARAIGPLAAGLLLAVVVPASLLWGATALSLACAATLVMLRRGEPPRPPVSGSVRIELVSALRFARYSRWTRTLLLRMIAFGIPASGLWALLPIYSRDVLGVDSQEFGILFAATGAGAVLGTLMTGPMRARMSDRAFAGLGITLFGLAMGTLPFLALRPAIVVVLIVAGSCWVTVQTLWMSMAQRALPEWVRASMIGLMLSFFQLSQVIGSLFWGAVADWTDVETGLVAAGVVMIANAVHVFVRGVPPTRGLDPDLAGLAAQDPPEGLARDRPVHVEITHYGLVPADPATRSVLRDVRLSRLRYGARTWELQESPADPASGGSPSRGGSVGPAEPVRHVERMRFSSWDAYASFEAHRLTVPEARVRHRLRELSVWDPEVRVVLADPGAGISARARGRRRA